MQDHNQEAEQFGGRTVPPATPPTINDHANADDAMQAEAGGDSDFPGKSPDEIQPGQGDFDSPGRSPEQEVPDRGGDIDQPGRGPAETPSQPDMPSEAPPPD
jgi:hypothetical protein